MPVRFGRCIYPENDIVSLFQRNWCNVLFNKSHSPKAIKSRRISCSGRSVYEHSRTLTLVHFSGTSQIALTKSPLPGWNSALHTFLNQWQSGWRTWRTFENDCFLFGFHVSEPNLSIIPTQTTAISTQKTINMTQMAKIKRSGRFLETGSPKQK